MAHVMSWAVARKTCESRILLALLFNQAYKGEALSSAGPVPRVWGGAESCLWFKEQVT